MRIPQHGPCGLGCWARSWARGHAIGPTQSPPLRGGGSTLVSECGERTSPASSRFQSSHRGQAMVVIELEPEEATSTSSMAAEEREEAARPSSCAAPEEQAVAAAAAAEEEEEAFQDALTDEQLLEVATHILIAFPTSPVADCDSRIWGSVEMTACLELE
nr:unnamed protein product [Digitaria exilis]